MDTAIPTRGRERLPKTLSYPLRASEIQDALADAVPDAGLSVDFRTTALLTSEYRELVKTEAPLPAVAVTFTNWAEWKPSASKTRSGDELSEEWRLEVYAVPRDVRAAIHDVVIEQGLAALHEWLTRVRPDEWYRRPGDRRWGKRCVVSVSGRTGEVSVEEFE